MTTIERDVAMRIKMRIDYDNPINRWTLIRYIPKHTKNLEVTEAKTVHSLMPSTFTIEENEMRRHVAAGKHGSPQSPNNMLAKIFPTVDPRHNFPEI